MDGMNKDKRSLISNSSSRCLYSLRFYPIFVAIKNMAI